VSGQAKKGSWDFHEIDINRGYIETFYVGTMWKVFMEIRKIVSHSPLMLTLYRLQTQVVERNMEFCADRNLCAEIRRIRRNPAWKTPMWCSLSLTSRVFCFVILGKVK